MPDGDPKQLLQITHGMTEHMGRYEVFAEYLQPMGIAVAGFDLRGHGRNSGDPDVASFGEGGWAASIEDMQLFYEHLQRRFSGKPHFMLGFSLGSFLLREYLTKYPDEGALSGAIIMGTGTQPETISSQRISRSICFGFGERRDSSPLSTTSCLLGALYPKGEQRSFAR